MLETLGYKRIRAARTLTGYGYGRDSIAFWVPSAERPVPTDEKSGLPSASGGPSQERVDAFHAAALHSGGQDYGRARSQIFTLPFVIDPDGYRIEAYYGPGET